MNALLETLRRLGPLKLVLLAAVGAGLLGFFTFFANRLSQPPMALLFSELAGGDAGQIVGKLEQQNVPFELRAGGRLGGTAGEPSAPGPTLVRLDEGRVNRRAESAGFPAGSAGSRKPLAYFAAAAPSR